MQTEPEIRLVIVDAQAIFRAGIRQICSGYADVVVAGEASRCGDVPSLCERLHPDLLLLDGALPGALSLVAQLRDHQSGLRIVLLVDRLDEAQLRRALQLGVVGYLLKQIEAFDLVQAMRSAAAGLLTLTNEAVSGGLGRSELHESDQDLLSEREEVVLSLLLNGLSNNAIAGKLRVSRATVKFHLRNIYSKLGVCSRTEALAVVYGQRRASTLRAGDLSELQRRRALAVAV